MHSLLFFFDFEQIRTVDMDNHIGFTVQRFRPTELRNHFYKFYKKLVLISINIKPIEVIISYFFFRKYEKKLHAYIYSAFIFY